MQKSEYVMINSVALLRQPDLSEDRKGGLIAQIKITGAPWNRAFTESQRAHTDMRSEPHAYRCSGGKLTIGVGRNREANGISQKEAISCWRMTFSAVRENSG
jgi:hypothetical protein